MYIKEMNLFPLYTYFQTYFNSSLQLNEVILRRIYLNPP